MFRFLLILLMLGGGSLMAYRLAGQPQRTIGQLGTFLSAAAPAVRSTAAPQDAPAGHPTERTAEASAPSDPTEAAAVAELNRFRTAAGLPPVGVNAESAAPLHAHYLALNKESDAIAGLKAHSEKAALPGYTEQGAAVAEHSNISQSKSTVQVAVRGLVDAPLHRDAMLSPQLTMIGVGGEDGFWVIDLSSEERPWRGKPAIVPYPAPGQEDVPLAFGGDEVPNPLSAIPDLRPDATVGYPITLHFYGCNVQGAKAQATLTSSGQNVPIYVVQPGTTLRAEGGERQVASVLLFPQQPLRPATTYSVVVNARCGSLGAQTYTWTFVTRPPLDPTATSIAVSAPDSDGWQSVRVRLLDTSGHPVEAAHAVQSSWTVSSFGRATSAQPQLRVVSDETAEDGELGFDFQLAGAPLATVQLKIACDGQTVTVPITVAPVQQGHLVPLPAHAPPIPIDVAARSAWQTAHRS